MPQRYATCEARRAHPPQDTASAGGLHITLASTSSLLINDDYSSCHRSAHTRVELPTNVVRWDGWHGVPLR